MYEYRARVTRVVDGDTIDVDVDLGLNVHTYERIRLARIDAPEVRGAEREAGLDAAQALRQFIGDCDVIVRTQKDRRGRYGRWVGEILYAPDNESTAINVNDWLVANGYARLVR